MKEIFRALLSTHLFVESFLRDLELASGLIKKQLQQETIL
jgi:hypothetical protein